MLLDKNRNAITVMCPDCNTRLEKFMLDDIATNTWVCYCSCGHKVKGTYSELCNMSVTERELPNGYKLLKVKPKHSDLYDGELDKVEEQYNKKSDPGPYHPLSWGNHSVINMSPTEV